MVLVLLMPGDLPGSVKRSTAVPEHIEWSTLVVFTTGLPEV